MSHVKVYDNFPLHLVILSNLGTLLVYALGAAILAGVGWWAAPIYLLYCAWLEIRLLQQGCANCYYYGKICGSGKGKLCPLLFKPGDPACFADREVSWAELLPDFIAVILPLVGGIVLLVTNFNWLLLAGLAALVVLYFGGNAVIRGSFMCKYCRQRQLGCPAEELFSQRKAQ
ncbi:MAG: hypothetical protein JXM69_13390 [Anaerolineae bacterium]|nr:hypothetical protein [Anaerolineae bacterium]